MLPVNIGLYDRLSATTATNFGLDLHGNLRQCYLNLESALDLDGDFLF